MRQRRDAAGVVNAREHLRRSAADARHERRPPVREPAIERLAMSATWPRATSARAIHGRPTDVAGVVQRRPQDCVGVERDAVRGERSTISRIRSTRRRRCSARNALQRRRGGVDEVAEHVDVEPSTTAVISMPGTNSMPRPAQAAAAAAQPAMVS